MTNADNELDYKRKRLGDRILYALELALEQEDVNVADGLARSLELAMTRNAGGEKFVERREYPPEIQKAITALHELRKKSS